MKQTWALHTCALHRPFELVLPKKGKVSVREMVSNGAMNSGHRNNVSPEVIPMDLHIFLDIFELNFGESSSEKSVKKF